MSFQHRYLVKVEAIWNLFTLDINSRWRIQDGGGPEGSHLREGA